MLYLLYALNIYKDKNVFFHMKGDYSKIWELAQYTSRLLESWGKDPKAHLENVVLKHRDFNALYDSLSEEASEEIRPNIDKINKSFERSVEFYKERFNL